MRAEEMFRDYHMLLKEHGLLEYQLSRFQGLTEEDVIESVTFSRPQGDKVMTSNKSDKTGKLAVNYRKIQEQHNDEWYDSLLERYRYLSEEFEFFDYALGQLSDYLPGLIRDLVVEKVSWEALESKYNISHRMVGKARQKAIKEMNDLYEMRDRQVEQYVLR